MKRVNVSTLKNDLSKYLRRVRKGEAILVLDRDLPIATLAPITAAASPDDLLTALEAEGIVRRGDPAVLEDWRVPATTDTAGAGVLDALLEDRRSGR